MLVWVIKALLRPNFSPITLVLKPASAMESFLASIFSLLEVTVKAH